MTAGHVPKKKSASSMHAMAPPLLSTTYISNAIPMIPSVGRMIDEGIPEKPFKQRNKFSHSFCAVPPRRPY